MASIQDKLDAALKTPEAVPVYYFASQEQPLVRAAARRVRMALLPDSTEEPTRIEGPVPNLGEVIAAAGALSFLGTKRVVELWEIQPSTMGDKDIDELTALFSEVDSAVLVVTVVYKDKKAAEGKRAKKLFAAAAKAGFAAEFAKPTRRENLEYLAQQAAGLGAGFAPGAAEALLERAGDDRDLLANEVAKLAAGCGYGNITADAVKTYAVHNMEADVFDLARAITAGRRAAAFAKLEELLAQRNEPLAITAALAGSFVDMYRVRCGTEQRQTVSAVFRDLGYKGSDYRLQKAKESAARYSTAALEECVLCLAGLDAALKSSALPDKSILLETALAQLLEMGERK